MVLLERWRQEVVETGRAVLADGRPTIAMETYVRLMVLKARYRWGYRVLVAEVSDSIHLRRFCRISLGERVPDESTVRKLTRRIGAETVNELTRSLIETAIAGEAVSAAGGQDRLDGRGGGRALPDRRGSRLARGEGARARGQEARRAGEGAQGAGAGPVAVDGPQAQRVDAHDPPPLGRGEGRGAGVDRADRRAVGALGQGSAQARRGRQASGGWARRGSEAPSGGAAGGARGPLREGRRPDPPAGGGRADQRPAGVDRPTRTPDRSARASSASPTSSGTSVRSARSPSTPNAARGD